MKFVNYKTVAALSIALLLSTQIKPMGHDTEQVLQAPMADAVEAVQVPTLAQKTGQALANGYKAVQPKVVNALGITKDAIASQIAAHPYMYAGAAAAGSAAIFAYKKPQAAKKAAIVVTPPVALAGLVAYDNKETLTKVAQDATEVGRTVAKAVQDFDYKNTAVNVGNAVVNFGKTAASVVANNAGKAVNYAVEKTPVVVDAVRNAAAKLTVENVKEQIRQHPYITAATAAVVATPVVAYAGYKARKPLKRIAGKAGRAVANAAGTAANAVANNAGKAVAVAAPVALAGLVAYDNSEVIAQVAQGAAVVVKNANSEALKIAANFYAKASERLGNSRLAKLDYKKMAQSAGNFLDNRNGEIALTGMTVGVAGVVAKNAHTDYKANQVKKALEKAAAKAIVKVGIVKSMVPMTEIGDELKGALKPLVITPAQVSAMAKTKPAPARPKSPEAPAKTELPVIVLKSKQDAETSATLQEMAVKVAVQNGLGIADRIEIESITTPVEVHPRLVPVTKPASARSYSHALLLSLLNK